MRPPRFALWGLGFRPFYLFGAAFAALSIALWALRLSGAAIPLAPRDPAWHGHEMLFGFATAIIAGFLFTAVRNWTQRPTPTGVALAAIVLLWLAGRVLALTPWIVAAGVVNALFPVAIAIGIGIPLAASGNRRNYFFIALLAALALAAGAFHLAAAGIVEGHPLASVRIGLDVVLFVVAVIGGRVIPMFTNNGVPDAKASRRAWLEKAALAALLAVLAADLLGLGGTPFAVLAAGAALLHAARFWLWQPWRTWRTPLVWSLHAAYAWVVVHLLLRSGAALGVVADTLATHALTVGVIGGMTLAMMTRTALGHSGRPLAAGRSEVACYALVHLAALVRVAGPLVVPAAYMASIALSAALWSTAFTIYVVRYLPILTRPRVDGKPG